ncbi:MAG: orotidine-5'-phosphate decarboxylase [Candidatus Sumerlaeia bacterium]|nr:orotidine-5'-phosphate decarboxylase [Candidatus Sumerlaeia bacterium]
MNALEKLYKAQERTGSLLSIGLEPSPAYLPKGMEGNLHDFEEFLGTIIEATKGIVCAYKFNLAFFESLGWEGMELLYAIREQIPEDTLLIADAKRSDIGTTARHYAKALFDRLDADAVTVNPLMGQDSVLPFLEWEDRLTFLLALTSNKGAADFLLPNDLYINIARRAKSWGNGHNVGLVTGATQVDHLSKIRDVADDLPFLVPGIGAQGGDLDGVIKHGSITGSANPGLVIHVTRGILPGEGDTGDHGEIIREKTVAWNQKVQSARKV